MGGLISLRRASETHFAGEETSGNSPAITFAERRLESSYDTSSNVQGLEALCGIRRHVTCFWGELRLWAWGLDPGLEKLNMDPGEVTEDVSKRSKH